MRLWYSYSQIKRESVVKTIKILLSLLVVALAANRTLAQEVVEDTIMVQGVCGDCKNRIEEAAYGKGVKYASWDKETKELHIAYRKDKVSLGEIERRIAKAGYDTEHVQAEPEDYKSLPQCCQYKQHPTH